VGTVTSWKDALALYRLVRGRAGALTPEERRAMVEAQAALQGRCCGAPSPLGKGQLDEVLRIGAKALAYAQAHGLPIPR
jgi:hypothetical protein